MPHNTTVAQVLTPDSLTELQQLLGDELYPITQLFAEQLTHDAEALQQLAQADDFAALAARAHAVKGSTGNMGASALAQLAAQMEQAAKQQDGARARSLLVDLPVLVEQTVQALKDAGFLRP